MIPRSTPTPAATTRRTAARAAATGLNGRTRAALRTGNLRAACCTAIGKSRRRLTTIDAGEGCWIGTLNRRGCWQSLRTLNTACRTLQIRTLEIAALQISSTAGDIGTITAHTIGPAILD
jgi:hypothetical protein